STVVEDLATVQPLRKVDFKIDGNEVDYLLFDWLRELLFHFDAEQLLFGKFEAHVSPTGLTATAWGEPLDRTRHNLEHEVKALTYHALRVEQVGPEWLAEVIVDI